MKLFSSIFLLLSMCISNIKGVFTNPSLLIGSSQNSSSDQFTENRTTAEAKDTAENLSEDTYNASSSEDILSSASKLQAATREHDALMKRLAELEFQSTGKRTPEKTDEEKLKESIEDQLREDFFNNTVEEESNKIALQLIREFQNNILSKLDLRKFNDRYDKDLWLYSLEKSFRIYSNGPFEQGIDAMSKVKAYQKIIDIRNQIVLRLKEKNILKKMAQQKLTESAMTQLITELLFYGNNNIDILDKLEIEIEIWLKLCAILEAAKL